VINDANAQHAGVATRSQFDSRRAPIHRSMLDRVFQHGLKEKHGDLGAECIAVDLQSHDELATKATLLDVEVVVDELKLSMKRDFLRVVVERPPQ